MATNSEILKLIDQAIKLDLDDIQIMKQMPQNLFVKQNIEAEKQSIEFLLKIRKLHATHTTK